MNYKKSIFTAFIIVLLTATVSQALPVLQLDISNGYYNNAVGQSGYNSNYNEETIVSSGPTFTLYALLSKSSYLNQTFYISAALWPKVANPINVGSFSFDSTVIQVTDDMEYGTPPEIGKGLAPHGVFDTYYVEFPFQFIPGQTVGKYNTQDHPGGFGTVEGNGLYYVSFAVDILDMTTGYDIHFDLYNNDGSLFAPFSHDAQTDPPMVPEPATMLLLGLGLMGVAGVRRKFSN